MRIHRGTHTLVALLALMPVMALASNPWDGTWQIKPESYKISGKPDVYELIKGLYTCGVCNPPYTVKADGSDQHVAGNGYYDSAAVKVVDDHTVNQTNKKNGKVMLKLHYSVSADGRMLTQQGTSYMGTKESSFTFTMLRTAPAKPGAHAISGSWQQNAASQMSDVARTVTLESTPKGLKMSWNGIVTDAEFGGPPVAEAGDPGHAMAALKKTGDKLIEETDTLDGKVSDVSRYQLSDDGKTIAVVDQDKLHDQRIEYVMMKTH